MRVSIRRPEDDLVGPCDARGRSRFPPHASLAPPVFSKPRDASNDCPDVVRGNEPRALELPWRILVTGAGEEIVAIEAAPVHRSNSRCRYDS